MSKLSVGDKIRFLNTVGGGTVKGFLNKQLVIIEDEYGFDVPVLVNECVVVKPNGNDEMEPAPMEELPNSESESNVYPTEDKVSTIDIPNETREGEEITACLAYLPIDIKNLSTTNYECYFVNDSNYWLFFNYMSRENNSWKSRYSGSVEPNTKIFLEEFNKQQLNELEKVAVQFIAFKHQKPYSFKNPCSVELRIDTVKFYKLHSFHENDYFQDDALIYYIIKNDQPEREILVSAGDLEKAIREKKQIRRPRKKPISRKQDKNIIEVDLHIEELIDTTAGMDNTSILEYQLQKFNEVMSQHIKKRNQKIVFIHGKGEGVLKKNIMTELKKKYPKCYHQDASFKEYGYGATMVTIK